MPSPHMSPRSYRMAIPDIVICHHSVDFRNLVKNVCNEEYAKFLPETSVSTLRGTEVKN